MPVEFDELTKVFIFDCPHCGHLIQVAQADINCQIFRHAAYKATMMQIPPHSSKDLCERLLASGEVYGCGKPFTFDGKAVVGTDQYN